MKRKSSRPGWTLKSGLHLPAVKSCDSSRCCSGTRCGSSPLCRLPPSERGTEETQEWTGTSGRRQKRKVLTSSKVNWGRRRQWHLVALLGDAARCLGGDVLRDGHGGHGLQRRRVRSGEAAAHALVDGTIPGEAAVLRQRAFLTAHWGESIQSLNSKVEQRRKGQRHNFCRSLLWKSYCLIWESWGMSQLHTEGKTREEEPLRLIWPSPLLPPNTETKDRESKPVSS